MKWGVGLTCACFDIASFNRIFQFIYFIKASEKLIYNNDWNNYNIDGYLDGNGDDDQVSWQQRSQQLSRISGSRHLGWWSWIRWHPSLSPTSFWWSNLEHWCIQRASQHGWYYHLKDMCKLLKSMHPSCWQQLPPLADLFSRLFSEQRIRWPW